MTILVGITFAYLTLIHVLIVPVVAIMMIIKACSMIFGDDVGSRW